MFVDQQGIPGYDHVCALARKLATIKTDQDSLDDKMAGDVIRLYNELHQYDKAPVKIVTVPRRKRTITRRFRIKGSSVAPGAEETKR